MNIHPMFDCHAHPELFGREDWSQLVRAAQKKGIQGCISAGVWWDSFAQFVSEFDVWVAEKTTDADKINALFAASDSFPVFASIGLHPIEVSARWRNAAGRFDLKSAESDCNSLRRLALAQSKYVWAIGETGFDLATDSMRGWNDKQELLRAQQYAFHCCCELAKELSVPLIIHSRSAWGHTREQLQKLTGATPLTFMIHCFPGSGEDARWLKNMGGFASFGGVLTWTRAKRMQEAVKQISNECLLFETDAPDLIPEFLDGRLRTRNEPQYLKDVIFRAAELKQCSHEFLAELNFKNVMRFLSVN